MIIQKKPLCFVFWMSILKKQNKYRTLVNLPFSSPQPLFKTLHPVSTHHILSSGIWLQLDLYPMIKPAVNFVNSLDVNHLTAVDAEEKTGIKLILELFERSVDKMAFAAEIDEEGEAVF